MRTFKVTFLPEEKTVTVDEGTTLLDASQQAGVYVNSVCGGEGTCGECRLQVLEGKAKPDKNSIGFFTTEEIKQGYVLACQTKVEDNLTVVVPARSRIEMEKIITEAIPSYSEPTKESTVEESGAIPGYPLDPIIRKVYLELPPPSLADNVANIDRVTRELSKKLDFKSYDISLNCLQYLPDKLKENDWKVTVTVARHEGTGRILNVEGGDTTEQDYGLAVDVGTTTVVTELIHLKTGKIIGVEANHNMQAHYGDDVITRMVFACGRGSPEILQKSIITNINALTDALVKDSRINAKDITCMVASGNTTMSHFLYGMTPCSLRLEPYVPTATVYPQVQAQEIGLNIYPHGIVEQLPSVASYIGGDTVAGILACGMADRPEVTCLIDCGTNAEIAIGNNEWLVTCSASAGPAFEGSGTKWGMRATLGAIEKVKIVNGKVEYSTISGGKPRGICGSGLIDCIYELVRNHIIGRDGKFDMSRGDPRVVLDHDIPEYLVALPGETETGKAVTITETDIANLIKSKGAIFAAVKSLVDYVGLTFDHLDKIYLAGGFGSSVDVPKAIAIGLLPDVEHKRVKYIGNSSLTGARMVLLSAKAFDASRTIARRMTNIELSNYVPFMNEFIASLFLPHTDDKLFPSVKY